MRNPSKQAESFHERTMAAIYEEEHRGIRRRRVYATAAVVSALLLAAVLTIPSPEQPEVTPRQVVVENDASEALSVADNNASKWVNPLVRGRERLTETGEGFKQTAQSLVTAPFRMLPPLPQQGSGSSEAEATPVSKSS